MDVSSPSLYDRLGGEAAIAAAVTDFYQRVLNDPLVSPFFAGLSMDALISKQIAFMTMAFGGPHQYTGRDLRRAHESSVDDGLTNQHFDRVAQHLSVTLQELGVADAERCEALAIVAGTRADVLGH